MKQLFSDDTVSALEDIGVIPSFMVTNGQLYWSNDLGWVDKDSADEFTSDERNKLNLPMGGSWVLLA